MYESDKDLSPSTFTGSYRAFYYSKVKRVALCLADCFHGDLDSFDQNLNELPNKGKYIFCSSSHNCESSS
jgi:hypothetical protein